ncbi:hypothetical protein GmHk_14G041285 [Glycine max]|nr:hypothetical protein GmHk_14G041285 [Glycine max]
MPQPIALGSRMLSLACDYHKKKMVKLPRLSDLASLSHRYFSKRMSVHPQKMNSLSARTIALSEQERRLVSKPGSLSERALSRQTRLSMRVSPLGEVCKLEKLQLSLSLALNNLAKMMHLKYRGACA